MAVNYLDNGTAVTLAKVPGQPEYSEMMERLIRTRPIGSVMRREPGRIPSLIRTVQRTLGFPTTDDAAIMGKMVSDLRKVSEKTLGKSLRGQKVSVTAPWQPLWKEDDKRDCDVNDALWAAGLKPWDTHSTSPLYLSEVRTSLAASGRLLCEPYGCHGFDRDPRDVPEYVYYIRYGIFSHSSSPRLSN